MPRTRKKIEASPDQGEFDPMAVGTAANNPAFEEDERPAYPEDEDGNLPQEPIVAEQETDTDPSDTNQLGRTKAGMTQGQQAAAAELKSYMQRMSNLAEEKRVIMDDIKELKGEIKGKGYDLKAFDLILKIDALTDTQKAARREQNDVNATYAHAVGIDEELL